MKRLPALILLCPLFLSGCVVISVFPFYDDGDLLPTKPLEGRWVPSDATAGKKTAFVFRKWTEQGCWFDSTDEDGKTNLVGEAHLFKLGKSQFLDLAVAKSDGVDQVVRPHFVLKIAQSETNLSWFMLDYQWMEDRLKREPAWLAHRFQRNEAGNVEGWILTAATPELRQLLESVANNPQAWSEPQLWRRAKP